MVLNSFLILLGYASLFLLRPIFIHFSARKSFPAEITAEFGGVWQTKRLEHGRLELTSEYGKLVVDELFFNNPAVFFFQKVYCLLGSVLCCALALYIRYHGVEFSYLFAVMFGSFAFAWLLFQWLLANPWLRPGDKFLNHEQEEIEIWAVGSYYYVLARGYKLEAVSIFAFQNRFTPPWQI